MPAGAGPLDGYQRYYSYRSPGKVVAGDYILKGMVPELHDRITLPWDALPASVHSVLGTDGPFISDGGCGQVGVTYDPVAKSVTADCAFPYTDYRHANDRRARHSTMRYGRH
jgi:hypothetical protein